MGAAKVRIFGENPKYDLNTGPNSSLSLSYSAGKLDYIEKTIGDRTWRKTFTWTGNNLTAVSEWVEQ